MCDKDLAPGARRLVEVNARVTEGEQVVHHGAVRGGSCESGGGGRR
jgi:hypothetical protein